MLETGNSNFVGNFRQWQGERKKKWGAVAPSTKRNQRKSIELKGAIGLSETFAPMGH
ncbi:hypothetical protein NSPZN2_30249 [Nitrospira defluvii]|uniref:Transposase n=1 Tax=Nitrospira defluvii TaxID=330214 RepID=A0ABM8RH09_9BACT|nr:hypothetical protein NSPZN2_30249 [Nitrospira defluvii]